MFIAYLAAGMVLGDECVVGAKVRVWRFLCSFLRLLGGVHNEIFKQRCNEFSTYQL